MHTWEEGGESIFLIAGVKDKPWLQPGYKRRLRPHKKGSHSFNGNNSYTGNHPS